MDIEFKQLPKLPRSPIGTRVSEVVREEMTYLKSRRAPLAGKIEVLRSWLVKYLPQQDECVFAPSFLVAILVVPINIRFSGRPCLSTFIIAKSILLKLEPSF